MIRYFPTKEEADAVHTARVAARERARQMVVDAAGMKQELK